MAWNVLQSASADNAGSASLTVTTPAFTGNLTAGGKLIAFVSGTSTTTVSTVKDSNNNSFSQVLAYTANTHEHCWIYVLDTPGGDAGTKPTVTATFTGTQNGSALLVQEVTGLATGTTAAAVLDGTAGTANGSGISFTWSFGAYTSAVASEYTVALYADDGDNLGSTNATPAGWIADAHNKSSDSNNDLRVYWKNSAGGAETVPAETVSGPNATVNWETVLVAFKLAAATPAPFYAARQPARAKLPQVIASAVPGRAGGVTAELARGTGNVSGPAGRHGMGVGANGAPVRNPVTGPGFTQKHGPARSVLPPWHPRAGRVYSSPGAPVANPAQRGPVFRQAAFPARARIPQTAPRGRCYSSTATPVRNPAPGPVFTQRTTPVRYRVPPWQPRTGRVASTPSPVIHPLRGPPVYSQQQTGGAAVIWGGRGRSGSGASSPVRNPQQGPPFRQASSPARARIGQNAPRGRVAASRGAPLAAITGPPAYGQVSGGAAVQWAGRSRAGSSATSIVANPSPGPVFVQKPAIRARLPLQPLLRGRTTPGSPGAPVANSQGPALTQAAQPARARLPLQPFLKGRVSSSTRGPGANPAPGPAFRQPPRPVRAPVPQTWSKGRAAGNPGAPVANPAPGPVLHPAGTPVTRARQRPAPGGRISVTRVISRAPVAPSAPLRGQQAGAAAILWGGRGRAGSSATSPVANPSPGPRFTPAPQPARAKIPPRPRGRVTTSVRIAVAAIQAVPGISGAMAAPVRAALPVVLRGQVRPTPARTPVSNPAPVPVAPRRQYPVRAILPQQPVLRGRITSTAAAVAANPVPGPVFRQVPRPVRAPVPQVFSKGRAAGSPGAPVRNPAAGPVFRQATQPARARKPLPPRGRVLSGTRIPGPSPAPFYPARRPARAPVLQVWAKGRTGSSPGAPVANPASGTAFSQATQPAGIRFTLPAAGRTSGNPGVPAVNPVFGSGPPLYPLQLAVRIVPPPPARGRAYSSLVTPAANPGPGPVLAAQLVRARIPQLQPRAGRVSSGPGAPVLNPAQGAGFRQGTQALRAALPVPFLKGRTSGNAGARVANPASGPVFTPVPHPVRTPVPQAWSKGRAAGNPGVPFKPPATLFASATQAVRARPPLPLRGRTAGNPGIPAVPLPPAVLYPQRGPARTIPPLPPRGRTTGSQGAPVANPGTGSPFIPVPWPARAPIPQNGPRGRTNSGPGAPVENKPFTRILISAGDPFTAWAAGDPYTVWETGDPYLIT